MSYTRGRQPIAHWPDVARHGILYGPQPLFFNDRYAAINLRNNPPLFFDLCHQFDRKKA